MNLLLDLKKHICARLPIKKTDVFAFIERAKPIFTRGAELNSVTIDHKGMLTISSFSGEFSALAFTIAEFVNERIPSSEKDPITIECELLSNREMNVFIQVALQETWRVERKDNKRNLVLHDRSNSPVQTVLLKSVTPVDPE